MPESAPAAIAENLARVRAAIADAAHAAGRSPESIRLIAVSKTRPAAAVAAAVAAGQQVFGESTMQDALTKLPAFTGRNLEWHFIGHLQSNKARHLPGNFAWWHSLDSPKLGRRADRFARDAGTAVNALIEVNISRDPARHGVDPDLLEPLVADLLAAGLTAVKLCGLMAIGPHPATEPERRAAFAALHRLRERCMQHFALPDFTELSMGMSDDYREAILEGSTMVRIGTAIFGLRR